tara:strand:- start:638 stop:907 length:270 start_codon:yes stop_codon:yes gene_type:complete
MAVKKPKLIWPAALVISIFVLFLSLSSYSNQIQSSPIDDVGNELATLPSPVTGTTISSAVAYVSYVAFIASGLMVSYNLNQTKKKKRTK